ncbi:FAD-dependent 5-carboxymethylaminomethyl-2-thiouridine(34) oxidoreductase MnmC [Thalassospira sp.]|uniref:FAD-dependent 5-carboxymethylaminomethyl-2-thiouridine(34) oxidoreductase MnmC n=1 Tax=Thalassospira sp. TaxID=1912094 RepID=UPI0027367DA4|nr:FAD-dependent 5-carboxymethylaminomethyl-2-thiouridine(34) oxidoreductase MnmC [Thalassospira sp.]MDP2698096.1 FAD-dependent 5-carboxymethylaminomethyl-2-thiouridine(34) oxidoreductase MnmC [Thalassospira sp.]
MTPDRPAPPAHPSKKPKDRPWFAAAPALGTQYGDVAVIGGGIAGAACADALQRRGIGVSLFEKNHDLAQAASGNPIGMLEPYLTVNNSLAGQFYEAGYRFSTRKIAEMHQAGRVEAGFCGVLTLAGNNRDAERQNALISRLPALDNLVRPVNADAASALFGLPLPTGGLFFPDAGWVNPPSLCKALCRGVDYHPDTHITGIARDGGGAITLKDTAGTARGPFGAVILAGAMETADFAQSRWLADYLVAVRGQISCFSEQALASALPGARIDCVLSHDGYLTPARDGWHVFGATFDRDDRDTALRDEDHTANLAQLAAILPDLAAKMTPQDLTGRAALRTTTPDHLPLIGPAPDYDGYLAAYPDLDKGRHYARYQDAPYHKGVYICTGFGARGMIAAPLAADIIASQICAMPATLPTPVLDAIHPARFIIRGLKRGMIAS